MADTNNQSNSDSLPLFKVINQCTHLPLPHIHDDRINSHIASQNNDGWELMSVAVEAIGIDEHFVMFWRKVVPCPLKKS